MPTELKTATNLSDVKKIVAATKANGVKVIQKLAGLNQAIAKQQESFAKNFELAGLTGKAAQEQLATSMHSFMKTFRIDNGPGLYALWSELDQADKALSYAKSQMTEPKRIATAFMIGSEERSRMEAQVDKLGKGALVALAAKAKAEANTPEGKLLATVIIEANDRIATAVRPLDSFDLAEVAFGREAKEARALIKEVQLEHDRAKILVREFETGKAIPALEKVRLGLNHPEGILPREESKDESKVISSTDKILAGLNETLNESQRKADIGLEAMWEAALAEASAA